MKRFGLFFSILFLALALCVVLVGCANQTSENIAQIEPSTPPTNTTQTEPPAPPADTTSPEEPVPIETELKYDPSQLHHEFDLDKLIVTLHDDYNYEDPNIFRTKNIGLEANPQDYNKSILIREVSNLYYNSYMVIFTESSKEDVLIALNEFSTLEIVKELSPKYVIYSKNLDFTTSDVPPNDYNYGYQLGAFDKQWY